MPECFRLFFEKIDELCASNRNAFFQKFGPDLTHYHVEEFHPDDTRSEPCRRIAVFSCDGTAKGCKSTAPPHCSANQSGHRCGETQGRAISHCGRVDVVNGFPIEKERC